MLFRTIYIVLLFFVCITKCFFFDITILPEKPKAGEGIFVKIKDAYFCSYKAIYDNKIYALYKTGNGFNEALIPVDINEKGVKKIIVKRKILDILLENKEVDIAIRPRYTKNIYLTENEEKKRKQQPSIIEQQILVLKALDYRSNKKLWNKGFVLPIKNNIKTQFASNVKGRLTSYSQGGVDIVAPEGTKVRASSDGRVILSENNLNVYGTSLIIDHGQGIVSCYFHLKKLLKKTDEMVKRGEIIAESGNTGWSITPHLYFAVYSHGHYIDPLWWINFSNNI